MSVVKFKLINSFIWFKFSRYPLELTKIVFKPSPIGPKDPNLTCSSNNINNIAIFGIIVNQVVTIVGVPSYTSGDQLCKGAAAILKRKPINIKLNPKLIPCIQYC
jgi:hypothetical protein